MEEFLDYLYQDVMIDLSVLDSIYQAVKIADPSENREAVMQWYIENIDGDIDE